MNTVGRYLEMALQSYEDGVFDDEDWKKILRELDQTTLKEAEEFATSLWEASKDLVSGHLLDSVPDGLSDERRWAFDYNTTLQYMRGYFYKSFEERKDKDENARAWLANKDNFEELVKFAADQSVWTDGPCVNTPQLSYVWAMLAMKFAEKVIGPLFDDGASRILRLWGLILSQPVSKSTAEFLKNVSRCFIWGFDTECVMLCRSSLDAAFRDAISDEVCVRHEEPGARYGYTLVQRIWAAYKEKCIDKTAKDAATRVNARGSKTVHEEPNVVKDVLGTVADTLTVINQLAKYMETPRD